METVPRMHTSEQLPPEVAGFFDELRREQSRFLDFVRQASSRLRRDSGQLPCVAANHARLTQQFFDGQRAILMRRAEVDAEVGRIRCTAEGDALGLVAAARAHALTGEAIDLPPAPADAIATTNDRRSPRQEVAALGVEVVRTRADAESLARVIEDAFEPDEPDGGAAQRDLASLLEDWWKAENRDGLAVIEDARARAAMRRHFAEIEARETIGVRHDQPRSSAGDDAHGLLPVRVLSALASARGSELQSLLVDLADSLTSVAAPACDERSDRVPAAATVDDTFRDFWTSDPDQVMRPWSG